MNFTVKLPFLQLNLCCLLVFVVEECGSVAVGIIDLLDGWSLALFVLCSFISISENIGERDWSICGGVVSIGGPRELENFSGLFAVCPSSSHLIVLSHFILE